MSKSEFWVKAERPRGANGLGKRTEAVSHKRASPRKDYKAELLQQLALVKIPVEPEFKIFESRRFKADWRVPGTMVLIEYEGGLFHKGKMGHSSVTGILRDIEKANLCALAGWIVVRVAPNHVESGEALNWIRTAVEVCGPVR